MTKCIQIECEPDLTLDPFCSCRGLSQLESLVPFLKSSNRTMNFTKSVKKAFHLTKRFIRYSLRIMGSQVTGGFGDLRTLLYTSKPFQTPL